MKIVYSGWRMGQAYPEPDALARFLAGTGDLPSGVSGDIDLDGGADVTDLVYLRTGYSLRGGAHTWGGGADDVVGTVAVDGAGNVLVTGHFSGSVDFDPEGDGDVHDSVGGWDAYLVKFDFNGNFLWARTWGGSGDETGTGLAVDGSGNAFVSGRYRGTVDFDPGHGEYSRTSNNLYGLNNAFLSKFDPDGNFVWARTWGGTGTASTGDEAYGVAADASGNAYVVGDFSSPSVDFNPGDGIDPHANNSITGFFDAFLVKFAPNGDYLWAKTWGGDYYDDGPRAAVDGSGHVYVAGMFQGTVDFDPGPGNDPHSTVGHYGNIGDYGVFLTKFDATGTHVWAKTWGGSGWDIGENVAVDGSGNPYIAGYFQGEDDFDPGGGADNRTSSGGFDAFLSKFDPDGNRLWSKTWGAGGNDRCEYISLDGRGSLYVTGDFQYTVDLDPGTGSDPHIANGNSDAFLTKFDLNGNFIWAKNWGGTGDTGAFSAAVDGWGDIYVIGGFSGSTDFDPSGGADLLPSNGAFDAFLSKFLPGGGW